MTLHTRVAIVGGGIYGCGLLLQLVEKGWKDVLLLEKSELTAGSTWHAAGFCTHYSFSPTHIFMRQFSTDLYRKLEQDGIAATGYHRCRGLRVTHDPDRIDEFRHGISVGRAMGIDFELLDPDEIAQVFPLMKTDGLVGGLYEPTDGYVDPAQTTHGMARLARAGGAKIIRQNPVESIELMVTGEWRLHTHEHEIIAEHVVLAPGFWANEVGQLMGLDLPITPMLHQYLVTDDHPDIKACDPDSIPLVRHHDYQWYSRQEGNGLILGAYESNPQTWAIDGVPKGFGMELFDPDLDRVAHLMADAMARMPMLNEAGIKTTVHGPVSYTADGQPLIGPAPGLPNAWLACGSGFGIGEGAGAGKLLAEWMVEGQPPMHMGIFDPRRFGDYADRDYRVAKAVEVFSNQFATHYPLEERFAGRPKKITPIYQRLKRSGARFGCVYGWERPNWFGPDDLLPNQPAEEPGCQTLSFRRTEWFDAVRQEVRGVANHGGVIDLSGFGKMIVSGPDAQRFLNRLSANRLPQELGEIRLCHFLNHKGTVECEFTMTRLDEHQYYLVYAAAACVHHQDWLVGHKSSFDVTITNITQRRGVLGLAGPGSKEILSELTDADLSSRAFPWLSARQIDIAGKSVLAMRMSYSGELGFELHHDMDDQTTIYDALKGVTSVAAPIDFGFYAMNSMRIEKAFKAWGSELTVENTALELGLERLLVLNDRAFIGKDALIAGLEAKSKDEKYLYYGQVETDDCDIIGGEAVFYQGRQLGVAVSGAYGHRTEKNLAFLLLPKDVEKDWALTVEVLGDFCPVRLLELPAYDPHNRICR